MRTGLGRKNWRGGFSEYYSGNIICFGISKPIESAGNKWIFQSSNCTIPSVSLYEVGIGVAKIVIPSRSGGIKEGNGRIPRWTPNPGTILFKVMDLLGTAMSV